LSGRDLVWARSCLGPILSRVGAKVPGCAVRLLSATLPSSRDRSLWKGRFAKMRSDCFPSGGGSR
jgi:hypothetical protein